MNDVVLKYFYPTQNGNLMIFEVLSDGKEPALLPYEGVPFSPEIFATSVNYGEPAEHSVCIGVTKDDEDMKTDVLIYRNGDWTPVDEGEEDALAKYKIKILGGVLYRESRAIGLASKVKEIDIGYGNNSIVDSAFAGETSIEKVTFDSSYLTIPRNSFSGCTSLKEINITSSQSVRLIESGAFRGCVNLKDINYDGAMKSWTATKKEAGWNGKTGDYVVHCWDGDILKEDDN